MATQTKPFEIPDMIYICPKKDDIVRWSPDKDSMGYAYIRVTKIKEMIREAELKTKEEIRDGN